MLDNILDFLDDIVGDPFDQNDDTHEDAYQMNPDMVDEMDDDDDFLMDVDGEQDDDDDFLMDVDDEQDDDDDFLLDIDEDSDDEDDNWDSENDLDLDDDDAFRPDIMEDDHENPEDEEDFVAFGEDYEETDNLVFFSELSDQYEESDGYLDGNAPAYENYDPDEDDGGVIGDPAQDMENWHFQETNSSCAVASQEFALEALTGREFSEAQLRDLAEQYGWYSPDGGTPLGDVGNILAHMGLNVEKSYGNTVSNIEQCLANGGEVIVGVDSSELWEGRSDDFYGPGMGADHAVQVIGIDHSTPMGPMVILNDSGCTNGCGAMIPLNDFMNAWEDSGCFMVEAYA